MAKRKPRPLPVQPMRHKDKFKQFMEVKAANNIKTAPVAHTSTLCGFRLKLPDILWMDTIQL